MGVSFEADTIRFVEWIAAAETAAMGWTWFPYVTGGVGAVAGGAALVMGLARLARETATDPHLMWKVDATEETRGHWRVDLSPVGGTAVFVFATLRGVDRWSVADTIPTIEPGQSLRIAFKTGAIGDAWVLVNYSTVHRPRQMNLAWLPVVQDGAAGAEMVRQDGALGWVFWLRRVFLSSPVRPGDGIPYRRAGWREQADLRRAIRAAKLRPWPAIQVKPKVRLPHQR